MRILRIHIKNLNSLRLQTTIDFEQPPLAHADIFAITGSTGAGKTTILDAITLALYGEVARDKSAYKEVLSYGATECLAEVEFLANGQRYLARWGMHRAHQKVDGNLIGPQRELAQWSAEKKSYVPIAEKVREVDEAVKAVTQLDFERFTRSVLLSQGDFAAFLKASDKEQSDLLERITGTAIYSQLSTAAFDRYRLEEQALKQLQDQQAQLGLLAEEPVSAAMLAKADQEVAKKTKALEKIQSIVQQYERWQEALQKGKVLAQEAQQLTEEEEAFTPEGIRLERSLALQPTREHFQELSFYEEKRTQADELLQTLKSKQKEEQQQLDDLAGQLTKAKTNWERLKKEAKTKEAIFREADIIEEQLKETKRQLTEKEEGLARAEKEEEALKASLAKYKKEVAALKAEQEAVEKWLQAHQQYQPLPAQLPLIEREREALRDRYQQLDKYQKELLQLRQQKKEHEKITEQEEKAHEALEKQQLAQQKKFDELLPASFAPEEQGSTQRLNSAITTLQEKKQLLLQLRTLDEAYQQLLKEQEKYEERLASLVARQQQNNKLLLSLVEERDHLQENLNYRRNIYQQQQLIANYEKDRQQLQPGTPCPLCLSKDHPFHEHPVVPFVDQAKEDLEKAEAQYEAVLQQERQVLREETALSKEIESLYGDDLQPLNGRLHEQRQKLLQYEEQIAGLLHPSTQEVDNTRGPLLREQIAQVERQLKEWRGVQAQLEIVGNALRKTTDQLQVAERNYLTSRSKLETTGVQLQRAEKDLEQEQARFTQATEEIQSYLTPLGFTFDLETARDTFARLSELAASYEQKAARLKDIAQDISINASKQETTTQSLAKHQEDLASKRASLQANAGQRVSLSEKRKNLLPDESVAAARQELEGNLEEAEKAWTVLQQETQQRKEALAATQQSILDTKAQQKATEQAIDRLRQQLTGIITELGYQDLAAVRSYLLPLAEEQKLQKVQQQLQQKRAENTRAREETAAEEAKFRKAAEQANDTEDHYELLQTAKDEQEQALRTLGQLEQQAQQQKAREKQFKELLQKIETQRQVFNRWAQLNEVIGQKDGKKFRSFAQGLTLQRLVAMANQHLERLNGRYLISKKPNADLTLEIIDTFQADNRRSMFTLSGGESFLISLALALGLSDLAGRHAQIQSLFIDEGFGTLDEHSLDLAISTLENLQSSGKTIGIISHVKALKERIGVQIQLRKQSSGFSDLEVVGFK